jgi:hypothetical protein
MQLGDRCRAEGIVFYPLPIESYGGVHDSAVVIIRKLGVALARASSGDEAETVKFLFGKLSILLKGNAALILNRVPHHPDPQINGQL